MHRAAVIPHDQVADPPSMDIDELPLRGERREGERPGLDCSAQRAGRGPILLANNGIQAVWVSEISNG